LKINDVTLRLFAWDGLPATRYAAQSRVEAGSGVLGLLTLTTDGGLAGHAFLGSALYPADVDAQGLMHFLKPLVLGRDPLRRERIVADLWTRSRMTSVRTIGAVDVALWDLAAKIAGLPIHALLGTFRESVPAYASSAILDSPEAYAAEAVHYQTAGWCGYKIHPPQNWREDIAVCQAVRAAVGPTYPLMLDAAWSYPYDVALRVGRAIEELGFVWYEDPLAERDIYNCAKLREKLDIPLMATEYPPHGLDAYAPWLLLRATDYLRGDVAVKGGITTLVKAAHLAEAFGLKFEVHHGGNSLNNVANLHVLAAIGNADYFEVLLPDAAHRYGLEREIEVDAAGLVHAPREPGLGVPIDFALIERKVLATLR
jgi:L-alanine-DL-glutamate epimerase-like enolase superfamily enzyme